MASKKDFTKRGLAAICIYNELKDKFILDKKAQGVAGQIWIWISDAEWMDIVQQAKQLAKTSPLLELSRKELEARATASKNDVIICSDTLKRGTSGWFNYFQFSNSFSF